MTTLNIEALLNMPAGQTALPLSASNTNSAQTGSSSENFLSILQSLTASLGNNPETVQLTKDAQESPDWLSALMSLLMPNGAPNNLLPTPDSSGEASLPSDLNTSLTDMMAVIQSMIVSDDDASSLAQGLSQTLAQAITDDAQSTDAPAQNILSLMQGMGLMQTPVTQTTFSNVQTDATTQNTPSSTTTVTTLNAMVQQALLSPTTDAAIPTNDIPQNGANEAKTAPTLQTIVQGSQTIVDNVSINADTASAATSAQNTPVDANAVFAQALTSATQNGNTSAQNSVSANATQNTTPADATQNAPATNTQSDFSTMVAQANPSQNAATVDGAKAIETPAAMQPLPDVPALHQIVKSVSLLKYNGESTVRLNLHPASLGQLLVQLHTHNGEVSIQMLAESAKAQSLIQNHLPQLKAAFVEQGFGDNGTFNVNVGSDASAFNTPSRQNARWENLSVSNLSNNNITEESPAVRRATTSSNRIDYQI